jgi:nucleotide-binding universal stress UspA family protein
VPLRERILVLCEAGRAGAAAIDLARELAELEHAALTVIGVAPVAPSGSRCGNSAIEYNEVVVESVVQDLEQARERLGPVAEEATFRLLIDGSEPKLERIVQDGGFDLVLLPAHRRPLRAPYHPEAARLRLIAGAEIRIVGPPSRSSRA